MALPKQSDISVRRLLSILERLFELPGLDVKTAWGQAVQYVQEWLQAEKVDAFLYQPADNSLHALGTSDTPLGRLQIEQGLHILSLARGGSVAQVYKTGQLHITGHSDRVEGEVPELIQILGVRSHIAAPISVAGHCRGVLSAQSTKPDFFSRDDLSFLGAVASWVGSLAHRAELVQTTVAQARSQSRRTAAEEMITMVAHELRNYLSPLRYRVELICMRAQKEARAGDLRDAEQAAHGLDRLADLTTELLDAERLERGLLSLERVPVDLMRLAMDVAHGLETAPVAVRVQGPPELVVQLDVSRIRQVLENLIGNAIKHSPPESTVFVKVRSRIYAEAGQHLAIVDVIDQGPGVTPEVLPYIFERFVSAGTARGLGLGLYLASRIVAAHRGTLTVSSPPGQGADFRITLPL